MTLQAEQFSHDELLHHLSAASVDQHFDELGLMNPGSRQVWRLLGIEGRPSRFRSEPHSAAS